MPTGRFRMIPEDEYRRLMDLVSNIEDAIGGEEIEAAFRARGYSQGADDRYAGMKYVIDRILEVLPERAPF